MSASGQIFDTTGFLQGLDRAFAAHTPPQAIEDYLFDGLARARAATDMAAQLTVLNELAGFYRSVSRHDDAIACGDDALDLIAAMGLAGSDAEATTLINSATALRAAGRNADALARYNRALEICERTMAPNDRRIAALHNNASMAYSQQGEYGQAREHLLEALAIAEAASTDPDADVDIASTLSNLALVDFKLGDSANANRAVSRAMAIFESVDNQSNPHVAAALAAYAQGCLEGGHPELAVQAYRRALVIIEQCYGVGSDAYAITSDNLATAEGRLAARDLDAPTAGPDTSRRTAEPDSSLIAVPVAHAQSPAPSAGSPLTGLQLSRAFWEELGLPLMRDRFPSHIDRMAVGLVGHGSECYGFDDRLSRDHDFGPGFCMWLTRDDYRRIGAEVQHAYDELPKQFRGFGPRVRTPRASEGGAGKRVGVFSIDAFFEQITGYPQAPAADKPHQWLLLEESTLAAATNGEVFRDPLGEFTAIRMGFKRMPEDVWLALISRRLGMISQAGQYNVPRMLDRGQAEGAWLAVSEFVQATASLVFLLNRPAARGYLPYYKWQFAALRRLASQKVSRLPHIVDELSTIVRLASAACSGGAQFGEGGKGSSLARTQVMEAIDRICDSIVSELRKSGLTSSDEKFLEWQRPFVELAISDPWLKSV
ncbi:DUF4037 domain-containing protein [Rarobacter incanus]|uniref:DUF4037 domain-containing protein n=1 Tax=Rarobacter incanus TaxID=153494 RepID=UPI001B85FA68|nr:DUF4037 domain-containing protein [Rarobacter incanus]